VQYGCWGLNRLSQEITMRAGSPQHQYDSVGLLDHGKSGEFCLLKSVAGGQVDMQDFHNAQDCAQLTNFFKWLASYVKKPKDLHRWREDTSCRIDLMACDVAQDEEGMKLITHLEDITGVNWAASTNKTGAGKDAANGFDWVMETEEGLGDISKQYFDKEKLVKWQHTASVASGLLIGGACVACAPVGMAVGAAFTAKALYDATDQVCEGDYGAAAHTAGMRVANVYTMGAAGILEDACNGNWFSDE